MADKKVNGELYVYLQSLSTQAKICEAIGINKVPYKELTKFSFDFKDITKKIGKKVVVQDNSFPSSN